MAIPKPDARHKVLEAAVAIVAREGAAHLTIDAVAAQAGLSKGGVLYHFPSKRALLDGMLERLLDDSETRSAYHRQQTGSRLAAWIETEREQSAQERATALALLANAAEDPSLLDPARRMIAETFEEVSRESQPDPAAGRGGPEVSAHAGSAAHERRGAGTAPRTAAEHGQGDRCMSWRHLNGVLAMLLLAGCDDRAPPPVEDQAVRPARIYAVATKVAATTHEFVGRVEAAHHP
jgi:AcrR family transcriptional regulator